MTSSPILSLIKTSSTLPAIAASLRLRDMLSILVFGNACLYLCVSATDYYHLWITFKCKHNQILLSFVCVLSLPRLDWDWCSEAQNICYNKTQRKHAEHPPAPTLGWPEATGRAQILTVRLTNDPSLLSNITLHYNLANSNFVCPF